MLGPRPVACRTLLIALLLAARTAFANPAAEKLFQDGRTALQNNQIDAACDAFRGSEELEPRIGTLLNLGDCEERRKHVASAWNAFIDAKGLADKDHDTARGTEAARRAKVLEARLPYLTLGVARVPGLVIQRNAVDVPSAEWDHDVPLDPGSYEVTAKAPNFAPWSTTIVVIEAQHLRVDVPALVAVPVAHVDPPPPLVDKPVEKIVVVPAPTPVLNKHVGVGLFTGLTSDTDWINGVRVILNVAPLGSGVVRLVPQLAYASADNVNGETGHTQTTYALGATLEYAYPVTDKLVAAGGLGAGLDFFKDTNADNMYDRNPWECLRLSPTLRLDWLDVALHYQLVRASGTDGTGQPINRFVNLFEVGLDFFVW